MGKTTPQGQVETARAKGCAWTDCLSDPRSQGVAWCNRCAQRVKKLGLGYWRKGYRPTPSEVLEVESAWAKRVAKAAERAEERRNAAAARPPKAAKPTAPAEFQDGPCSAGLEARRVEIETLRVEREHLRKLLGAGDRPLSQAASTIVRALGQLLVMAGKGEVDGPPGLDRLDREVGAIEAALETAGRVAGIEDPTWTGVAKALQEALHRADRTQSELLDLRGEVLALAELAGHGGPGLESLDVFDRTAVQAIEEVLRASAHKDSAGPAASEYTKLVEFIGAPKVPGWTRASVIIDLLTAWNDGGLYNAAGAALDTASKDTLAGWLNSEVCRSEAAERELFRLQRSSAPPIPAPSKAAFRWQLDDDGWAVEAAGLEFHVFATRAGFAEWRLEFTSPDGTVGWPAISRNAAVEVAVALAAAQGLVLSRELPALPQAATRDQAAG